MLIKNKFQILTKVKIKVLKNITFLKVNVLVLKKEEMNLDRYGKKTGNKIPIKIIIDGIIILKNKKTVMWKNGVNGKKVLVANKLKVKNGVKFTKFVMTIGKEKVRDIKIILKIKLIK